MSFVFFLTFVELVKIRFWNVYQTLKIQRRRKLGRWFFNTPCSYNWKSHRVRVTHTDKTNRERKRRLWWLFWRHKIITYFVFYYNRTRLKTSEPLFYLNGLFERTPKAHHQKKESFYSKSSAQQKRILTRTRWETRAKKPRFVDFRQTPRGNNVDLQRGRRAWRIGRKTKRSCTQHISYLLGGSHWYK